MRINIKYILIIILVLFIGLISFIVLRNYQINSIESVSEIETGTEYIEFNSYEDTEKILMKVIVKNGDWSKMLLTENFKNKYNAKDGILGDIQFDKVEYKPYHNGKYSFEDRNYFVITQGKKKTAYTFNLIGKNGSLDDIRYFEIFNITDEYGNELDSRVGINEENFNRAFYMLSRGSEDERSIAVTDRFHRKYPYFLDLFEHYSPLSLNSIIFDSEKSSWENRIAYFELDSVLECLKREYEVKFTLDERGYLDDAVAKCINIKKYERNNLTYPGDTIIYKNSNWDNLKLTNRFKSKYNLKDGCLPNIDNINVSISAKTQYDGRYKSIRGFTCKDGSIKWYYMEYINDENGYLDDILIIPIDYNGTDAKEAKEIYLKGQGK